MSRLSANATGTGLSDSASPVQAKPLHIGFIGFGNMAQAIARGLVGAGIPGETIHACARDYAKLERTAGEVGALAYRKAAEVVQASDLIFVAVQPQVVGDVLSSVAADLAGKVVVSIAWDVLFEDLGQMLPEGTAHLSAIPNIPVSAGAGAWLCEDTHNLSDDQLQTVVSLMESCGKVYFVPGRLMGTAGVVTSCGPAFASLFVEALGDAAVKHGLPRGLAYRLASQMIAGSGELLESTGMHPAQLKDAVCSPGGATIRGVAQLEGCGLRDAVIRATDAVIG